MKMFFNICFGVGTGYTILSFFFGELLDIANFDGEFDFGSTLSLLKPYPIALFLTVFGGVGSIMITKEISTIIIFIVSCFFGVILDYALIHFILIPLNKAQNTSAVERQTLIGTNAVITVDIPQGGFGKITYKINGNTYSSPAKSEDSLPIPKYENVKIIAIEKNTYFVRVNNNLLKGGD